MVIGNETIKELRLKIDLQKQLLMVPNENWAQPTEKRYNIIKGLIYPDLSIQANQQLAVIEDEGVMSTKEKIEMIEEMEIDQQKD